MARARPPRPLPPLLAWPWRVPRPWLAPTPSAACSASARRSRGPSRLSAHAAPWPTRMATARPSLSPFVPPPGVPCPRRGPSDVRCGSGARRAALAQATPCAVLHAVCSLPGALCGPARPRCSRSTLGPGAAPLPARGASAWRVSGLARARACVVHAVSWRGSPCSRRVA
jgi:hypothetical protein